MSIEWQQRRMNIAQRWPSMLSSALLIGLAVIGVATAVGQDRAYVLRAEQVRAKVDILALSTSVTVAFNRAEVYLAVVSTDGGGAQLAKLVDSYSPDGNPILRSVLVERRQLRMTLIRKPECDSPARSFFLSSGDTNIFDVSSRSELLSRGAAMLPCFTVIHAATRLGK
jgi:hypothetical protein